MVELLDTSTDGKNEVRPPSFNRQKSRTILLSWTKGLALGPFDFILWNGQTLPSIHAQH